MGRPSSPGLWTRTASAPSWTAADAGRDVLLQVSVGDAHTLPGLHLPHFHTPGAFDRSQTYEENEHEKKRRHGCVTRPSLTAGPALPPGRPSAGAAGGSRRLSLPAFPWPKPRPSVGGRNPCSCSRWESGSRGNDSGPWRGGGVTVPCRLQPQAVLPDPEAWSCSPDPLPTWLGFGARSVKGGQVTRAE